MVQSQFMILNKDDNHKENYTQYQIVQINNYMMLFL